MRYTCNLFFLVIFSTLFASAQVGQIGNASGANDFRAVSASTSGMWTTSGGGISEIKGSPYLFGDWKTTGILVTKNDKKFKLTELNYDAKLDQIVAKISNDSIFSFNPASIKEVVINKMFFKRYLDPEFGRNSFYQVIAKAKGLELLKRNTITIKEGVFNPLTQAKQTPDSYVLQENFFLNREGKLENIALRKSKILAIFKNHSKKMKDYISNNNLSVKDEIDLQKIFIHYNTL